MTDATPLETRPRIRGAALIGGAVIAAFFGGFLGWAALAPLESAAVVPGVAAVEGSRKTVQHLEGGIVGEILVRDGDRVRADDVLVRLDDTTARVTLDILDGRRVAAAALTARLLAERDGAKTQTLPDWLEQRRSEARVAEAVRGEAAILAGRAGQMAGHREILGQRIAQYAEEIKGIEGQIAAEREQLRLIDEEIKGVRFLYEKGLAKRPRLLKLQRRAAEISGSLNMHRAKRARTQRSIGETWLRISGLATQRLGEVVEALKSVRAELFDLEERVRAAEDVFARTRIRSPLSGTVVDLKLHTPGGVIQPGEPLMDIVPAHGRLIVEARIDPKDIDVVQPGLPAQLRFTAFNQRHTAPREGVVRSVSADVLTDPKTGASYYLARIHLAKPPGGGGPALQPGMEAEVVIQTGARTALDYMLEPLLRSFNRAFREGVS